MRHEHAKNTTSIIIFTDNLPRKHFPGVSTGMMGSFISVEDSFCNIAGPVCRGLLCQCKVCYQRGAGRVFRVAVISLLSRGLHCSNTFTRLVFHVCFVANVDADIRYSFTYIRRASHNGGLHLNTKTDV